ncbi:MAG: isochorismate synthase [Polyangiales bacterium]
MRRRVNDTPLVLHTVEAPGLTPEDLLGLPGDEPAVFFADDHGASAWRGAARRLRAPDLPALAARVRDAWQGLAAATPPRAFVVAPFARDPRHEGDPAWRDAHDAQWVLPRLTLTRTADGTAAQWWLPAGETPPPLPRAASRASTGARAALDDAPERRARWSSLIRDALDEMRAGRVAKLVGARRESLRREGGWHLDDLVRHLAPLHAPGSARFAFHAGGTSFVGLTPETLLRRRGDQLRTEALAGSLARDPAHDARDRDALRRSEKDLREHALVAEMILRTLAPWCAQIDAPATPEVRSLRALHHLCTPITATLRPDAPDALTLAAALHPTPAVAGMPVDPAVRWIVDHEDAPRGWYAGALGWCDAAGDGRLVVALRAAVLRGERAWTYAGAGLVPGSDPDREWDETAVKMAMMREALGA